MMVFLAFCSIVACLPFSSLLSVHLSPILLCCFATALVLREDGAIASCAAQFSPAQYHTIRVIVRVIYEVMLRRLWLFCYENYYIDKSMALLIL